MQNATISYQNQIKLNNLLTGKKINSLNYSVNIPLEDNCVKITFDDNSYFLVYAILRIVENGKILLCSSDYYFDKSFNENVNDGKLEDSLISDALKEVNKLLKDKTIVEVQFNEYGDLIVFIDNKIFIEVFLDIFENDKDYYTFYGKDKSYFSLYMNKNNLTVIEGCNE